MEKDERKEKEETLDEIREELFKLLDELSCNYIGSSI